jgi:acyl-coenzyme A synthetase/AMP-(fatty) acid ligase
MRPRATGQVMTEEGRATATAAVAHGLPGTWWGLVDHGAARWSDRPMLTDERGRSLTFGEYRDAAQAVAAGLAGMGVGEGTTVSWQLPTVLEAAVLMAALARLGAAQNPIIPILRDAEVGHIVGQVGPDLLVTPGVWRGFDYAAMARRVADAYGVQALVVDHASAGPGELSLPHGDPAALTPAPTGAGDAIRWIYFSSGTTSVPKGAKHSDRSVMAGSNGIVEIVGLRPDDVFPMAYPITHVGGHAFMTAQLRVGCKVVLIEQFDAGRSPGVMAQHGATILGSAPPFFHAYLQAQRQHGERRLFPRLRMGMSGGAPSPPELHGEVKQELGGAGVISGWGLTEFPIATESSPDDPDPVLAETVGRPARGVSIRVVGPDGRQQPPGSEGELRLRGPQMFLGYLDAALDREAFDEEGWFATGDLGVVDTDGNVRITGRIKDVIIRNAENISAAAVEQILHRHPDIVDVAVVGIPDPRTGERCCAAVVVAAGAGPLSLADVVAHCRSLGLADQRIPERLDVVGSLPRNAMGKLVKQEIRAQVMKLASAEGAG